MVILPARVNNNFFKVQPRFMNRSVLIFYLYKIDGINIHRIHADNLPEGL